MKLSPGHPPLEELAPGPTGASRPPCLLHAETDAIFRQRLGRKLAEAGWSVRPAPTAEAARQLLQTETFDLVIVGHGHPDLNGVELAGALRQAGSTTPVIVAATGPAALRDAERVRMPAVAATLKPVDLALFLSIIQFTLLMDKWG